MDLSVAFATDDGENLFTKHAGQAKFFDVYRISSDGAHYQERRNNSKYEEEKTAKHGDPKKAQATLGALSGLHVLAANTYGPNLPRLLKKLLCIVIRTQRVADAVEIVKANRERIIEEYEKGETRKHLVFDVPSAR